MVTTTQYYGFDLEDLLKLADFSGDPLAKELANRIDQLPKYKEVVSKKCLDCEKKYDVYLDEFLK